MKPTRLNFLATASVFLGAASSAQAELHKANNNDALTAATAWVENAVPGTTENLIWDSTVSAATATGLFSFGNGQFTGGVTIQNPGGKISLRVASSGTTTWANNALIDMSSADLVNTDWTGGTLRVATANFSPTVTVATGRTLTIGGNGISNQGNSKTLSLLGAGNIVINPVMGGNAMNLLINGPTVTMNAASSGWSRSGQTDVTVSSGSLIIGNSTVLGNRSLVMNSANGLKFGTGVTTAQLGSLAGSGSFALDNADLNPVALTVGSNGTSQNYTGTLTGAGTLTKVGAGSLQLTGTTAGTVPLNLNEGTLIIGNFAASGTGTVTALNGTTIHLATSTGASNSVVVSGASANVTLTSNQASAAFAGSFTGSADQKLTISGAGGGVVNMNETTKQLQNFLGTVDVLSGVSLSDRSTNLAWQNGSDNALFNVDGTMTSRNAGNWHLGALSGSGSLTMGGAGSNGIGLTYTIGARNTPAVFAGVISDADTANGKIVSVIKTGSAVQTFSGINTYTGRTTVSGGTLSVSKAYLADTSTVNVVTTNSAVLDLNFSGGDFVTSFEINGAPQAAGIYGAPGSVLPIIATPALSGTGLLYVNTPLPGGGDYTTWSAIYAPADLTNMAGDNDNDGLTNKQEYAYGLNPVSGSSINPILVQLKTDGTFTYQRRSTTGYAYTVLTSTDLVVWTPNTPTSAVVTPSGDNESVAVTLSGLPLPAKLFVRIAAE